MFARAFENNGGTYKDPLLKREQTTFRLTQEVSYFDGAAFLLMLVVLADNAVTGQCRNVFIP